MLLIASRHTDDAKSFLLFFSKINWQSRMVKLVCISKRCFITAKLLYMHRIVINTQWNDPIGFFFFFKALKNSFAFVWKKLKLQRHIKTTFNEWWVVKRRAYRY